MSESKRQAVCLVLYFWMGALAFWLAICSVFWDDLPAFHEAIRGSLFTGFITLGSFLLTTKTFVITRLQDGLFHTVEYDQKYREAVLQHGQNKTGARNEGLRRLTEFLVWSVFSCMTVAVVQLALSGCKTSWASAISLSASGASIVLVIRSWMYIRSFIHQYLEFANSRPLPPEK